MRPVSERDVKIEKATGEPMINSERMTVIVNVKAIALTGTSQPGRTLAKNPENGMPPSRAKDLNKGKSANGVHSIVAILRQVFTIAVLMQSLRY